MLGAEVGLWKSSPDRPAKTECVQQLADDLRMSLQDVRRRLEGYARTNNAKLWPYTAFGGPNSNSFAFSVAQEMLGERPVPGTLDCDGTFTFVSGLGVPGWKVQVL